MEEDKVLKLFHKFSKGVGRKGIQKCKSNMEYGFLNLRPRTYYL